MSDRLGPSASWRGLVELPPQPSSVRRARGFVGDMLAVWGRDDPGQIAALLTSEIVTNAVRHAGSPVVLEVSLRAEMLRVAATDADPRRPVVICPDALDATHGRGMFLVSSLSERWGIEQLSAGKVVWFEVPVRPQR